VFYATTNCRFIAVVPNTLSPSMQGGVRKFHASSLLRNLIAVERNQSSRTAQSFLEGLQAEVCNAFALARIVYNTPAMLQLSSKTTRPAFAGRVLVRFLSL
jgi:hypothetical protein